MLNGPRLVWLFAGVLLGLATGCGSPSSQATQPDVTQAQVRVPVPGSKMTAGYFTIHNRGLTPLTLTGASSPEALSISLHTTQRTEGTIRMRPLGDLTLAPDEIVRFSPGGRHMMISLMQETPLTAGSDVVINLHFADREDLRVPFRISAL